MNNATQVLAAFREMTANKAISRDELYDLIKDGILAALAKRYGPNVEAEIEIDEDTGRIGITVLKEVVAEVEDPSREISLEEARWDDPEFEVGDILEVPVEFAHFGRNAVMAAKQRILQRVREGERQKIRDEYEHRVGELLSGETQQVERGKLVLMLNRSRDADAIIPWKEQNPRERFRQGEPIRAVLKKVEETPKGPRLILSRADPLFVAALFKLEVPEIQQGIVEIRGAAREVGFRSKIAVSSRDESIDPVGACVGLKGSRVRAVVQELGGERIDIVPWHPDPEIYAKRALAPARVAKVISNYETRTMTAIVDEDQLSLAIGRNGQNVRLASQLIGWQLDLFGSREWLERGAEAALFGGGGGGDEGEYDSQDFSLRDLDLAPATLAALEAAGYNTFYDVIDMEREDFLRIPGLGGDEADRLVSEIERLTVEEEEDESAAAQADDEAGEPDAGLTFGDDSENLPGSE
ncbi:transcription termination factor NusA [Longimicrobium sp.]|uniref:transcription termination factor NusA n=1 Tax=Longimicrobium sp. TaxID=2029185 RepID=UPI002E33C96C|nr:transcription termination factor NusA [Longimicrobium sp.]HEX6042217.1 transcription termination factor NusA [Longimicrobium sp.]